MSINKWVEGELVLAEKMNQLAWKSDLEEYMDYKKFRFVTQSEYDKLTPELKDSAEYIWCIVDSTEEIPTKLSQLINDMGYTTSSQVAEMILQMKGDDIDISRFATKEDLKNKGYTVLTLGVEPEEIRNKEIYKHYGFVEHIKNAKEVYPDGTEIDVEYYGKKLK